MASKTITIAFDGYWRDEKKSAIPANSGIYCVFECTRDISSSTVSLHKLIYIGESGDVKSRISDHEKHNDWNTHVRPDNELCFAFGAVGKEDRIRAEAAMIFKHKPPENTEYVESFPFDTTMISLSGKKTLLKSQFTVCRT